LSNRNSLIEIFTNEFHKLRAYVNKFIKEYGALEAEDIIQDVALNLFSKPDFDAPIENATAFVYRSIKNKIIDNYRSKKKIISIDNDETYFELEDENYNTDVELEKNEEILVLLNSMELLSESQRQIIIETEFEGKTFAELSEEWKVPIGTLLNRKHRAMSNLQKILNK
jgi:RNA polymerase sigma factor (sigma-70 family)